MDCPSPEHCSTFQLPTRVVEPPARNRCPFNEAIFYQPSSKDPAYEARCGPLSYEPHSITCSTRPCTFPISFEKLVSDCTGGLDDGDVR